LIGLAFQLEDPENLLGRGVRPGITCALIPRETPGVVIDRRHDPLGVPFYNSPTQGHDVVVPVNAIIVGTDRAGHGWTMLMESLAAGRGISLPAQSAGTTKIVARVASAHATIRKQFNLPIGQFEGVAEPLARIAASAYAIDAARLYACGALNQGIRPPVITAILKYLTTDLNRRALNDGMDILGGQGITLGPRNPLAPFYIGAPIPITVEGANILTRTLIIFGQGALRAHPYALAEVLALETGDLAAFDKAFWAHAGHIFRNGARAGLLTLTRGALVSGAPEGASHQDTGRYWKKLSWASAQFAWLTDLFMGTLGGKLRLREALTGRFADALAWMFVLTACLRRFEAEGSRTADLPFLRWNAEHACARIQEAFEGILANARVPVVGWFLRGPWRWLVRACPLARDPSGPDDRLTHTVAELIRVPDVQRDHRIAGGIFVSRNPDDRVAELERVFRLCFESNALLARRRRGEKMSLEEEAAIARAETARHAAIQVDSFTQREYADFDRIEENPNPAFPDTHPEAA
jgi:acyl-CoA dehydrogenase